MSKFDAFGTELKVGNGALQVETATIVGTITGSGDATFTITSTGMTGTALAISVAVLEDDTPAIVASKAAATIRATAAVTAMYYVSHTGAYLVLTRKSAVANVADLNIAYTNDDCTGLTADTTSDATTAGGEAEVFTAVGQVTNISGPGLSADTEDVTCHDSTDAFEEVVVTLLRSGEVSFDIVYDPANATHAHGVGILNSLDNKIRRNFQLVFPDTASTTWSFSGDFNGFEPSAAADGYLSASVKVKLNGVPTLV